MAGETGFPREGRDSALEVNGNPQEDVIRMHHERPWLRAGTEGSRDAVEFLSVESARWDGAAVGPGRRKYKS